MFVTKKGMNLRRPVQKKRKPSPMPESNNKDVEKVDKVTKKPTKKEAQTTDSNK